MRTVEITIHDFKDKTPTMNQSIAFVCPVESGRWEVGWRDHDLIRIEGGESFEEKELTEWFALPEIGKKEG